VGSRDIFNKKKKAEVIIYLFIIREGINSVTKIY
jgi:hypothetical protein